MEREKGVGEKAVFRVGTFQSGEEAGFVRMVLEQNGEAGEKGGPIGFPVREEEEGGKAN